MFCRNCGTEIMENARFCAGCGTGLVTNQENTPPPLRRTEYIYDDKKRDDDLIYPSGEKSVGLTGVLNFLWPGLGNIYCGQTGKGIIMMLLSFIINLATGFLLCLIICTFAIIDGVATAKTLNAGKPVKKWGFF